FVKVLDFGIAKVGGNASKLTRAGQVFGTPHYMSPEQCSGSGVDHRTDIYALGIMMYEMATGRVPFDADNLMGILTKHLYEEAVPPRQINPDLPEGLETVIFRCITKNADERYQTMAEVMADLDQLDAGVAPAARPDPAGRQAVAMASTQEMQAAAVGGRSKLLPIGLGVGAFALAGVATAFFLGSGDSALPPAPAGSFEKQAQAAVSAEMAAVEAEVEAESEKGKAEDAQTEEEGALDTDRVAVQSEPPEAQVFLGEDLIGNAPVKIPRPNKDEKVTLELRASGHQTQSVRISHLTAESVKVTLEKEKEKRSRRWGRRSAKQRKAAKQANKQQPKADKPTEKPAEKPKSKPKSGGGSSLPQTEVLDPWKN
ncbi:MAG: protein kinase domain-containing protein, partial [Myxococcota bacterium]